jgi:hypothetical protein
MKKKLIFFIFLLMLLAGGLWIRSVYSAPFQKAFSSRYSSGIHPHLPIAIYYHPRVIIVKIPAVQPWVNTGVVLSPGEEVHITASGTINDGSMYAQNATSGPQGLGKIGPGGHSCTSNLHNPQPDPYLVSDVPCESLVGYIGQTPPPAPISPPEGFEVGPSVSFRAKQVGTLYLSVNDNYFPDNSGYFRAVIQIQSSSQPSQQPYSQPSQQPYPGGAPVLFKMTPISGPPGTIITFIGKDFGTGRGRVIFTSQNSILRVTRVESPILFWSSTRITVKIPENLTNGFYNPSLFTARQQKPVGPGTMGSWPLFQVIGGTNPHNVTPGQSRFGSSGRKFYTAEAQGNSGSTGSSAPSWNAAYAFSQRPPGNPFTSLSAAQLMANSSYPIPNVSASATSFTIVFYGNQSNYRINAPSVRGNPPAAVYRPMGGEPWIWGWRVVWSTNYNDFVDATGNVNSPLYALNQSRSGPGSGQLNSDTWYTDIDATYSPDPPGTTSATGNGNDPGLQGITITGAPGVPNSSIQPNTKYYFGIFRILANLAPGESIIDPLNSLGYPAWYLNYTVPGGGPAGFDTWCSQPSTGSVCGWSLQALPFISGEVTTANQNSGSNEGGKWWHIK